MTNQNKRVILVTGASRGVGKGIAEGMARKGDIIICAARSQKKGSTVQQFGFEIQSSLDETVEKIKEGSSIIIFPEGTRSEDGQIGTFKKGSNLIASRSKSPMVPITLIGSGDIIKKGGFAVTPGLIKIIISPPVEPKNNKKENDQILESIRRTIIGLHH